MSPLVSVLMYCHNNGEYISKAIGSLILQTHENWQLCFIDDNSEDASYNIALEYSTLDSRICTEHNNFYKGLEPSLNTLDGMSEGSLMTRLDAKDLYHPSKLDWQIEALFLDPEIKRITCDTQWVRGEVLIPQVEINPISEMAWRHSFLKKEEHPSHLNQTLYSQRVVW